MIQKIQEHFNDKGILKLNIRAEIADWNEELLFNNKETRFYGSFLESSLFKKSILNTEDPEFLFHQLQHIQKENSFHLQALMEFRNKLEGIGGDGVQCENFYIKDYLTMKEALEKHLRSFRTVKSFIYKYLGNNNIMRINNE